MSNYAAGPPGHGGYPPPGYGPLGYPPPGYPPPGWGPPGWGWKPGVIPLFSNSATRGLTMGDIFRGAVGYIRANPKATLGLTAAVVAVTAALARLLQFLGPSNDDNTGLVLETLISAAATAFGTILLSGMLTVVVARAVFGSTVTVGEAWRRVRGRLPALIGMGALQLVAVVALIGATVLVIVGVARAANGAVAALIGFPLVLILIAALAYLFTVLTFAPVAIVLEQKPILAALERSFALVRHRFWRILGIRVLAGLIATVAAGLISVPFMLAGLGYELSLRTTEPTVLGMISVVLGQALGQIITAPFAAGVVVLLYVDARIRSEAFDVALRAGASAGRGAVSFTDTLWATTAR